MEYSSNFKSVPKATFSVDLSSENPRVSVYSNGVPFFQTELASASPELRAAFASNTSKVIICPPFKSIVVSTLTPPPVARSKQAKLVPSLLNIQLPFKLDECKYVFNRLGTTFVAQTIRNTELAETIALATNNKLIPTNIAGYIQIIWESAITQSPTWGTEAERALCIANKNASLLIIGNKDGIVSTNTFNNSSAKEIIKRLKLAFKGDISKVALFLAGEETSTVLRDMRNVAPLGLINVAESPEYFIANACAASKNVAQYNFIGKQKSALGGDFSASLKQKLASMFLLVGIITFIASFFINSNTDRIKKSNQAYFNNATKQVAGYDIKIKGTRAINEAKAAYENRIDYGIINAEQSTITSKLFPTCMEICKKHGVTLGFISLNSKGITASGSAPTANAVTSFVDELNANGIKCVLTNTPSSNDGRASFQLFPGK